MATKYVYSQNSGYCQKEGEQPRYEWDNWKHLFTEENPKLYDMQAYDGSNSDRPIVRYPIKDEFCFDPNKLGSDQSDFGKYLDSLALAPGDTICHVLAGFPSFHHMIFSQVCVQCGSCPEEADNPFTASFSIVKQSDKSVVEVIAADVDLCALSSVTGGVPDSVALPIVYHPFDDTSYTLDGEDIYDLVMEITSLPYNDADGNMVMNPDRQCFPDVCARWSVKTIVEDTCNQFMEFSDEISCCIPAPTCTPCEPCEDEDPKGATAAEAKAKPAKAKAAKAKK